MIIKQRDHQLDLRIEENSNLQDQLKELGVYSEENSALQSQLSRLQNRLNTSQGQLDDIVHQKEEWRDRALKAE